MYYKEEWINGRLFWKGTPNADWIEFTTAQYAKRLLETMQQVKNLNEETETKPRQCDCFLNMKQVFCDYSCTKHGEA